MGGVSVAYKTVHTRSALSPPSPTPVASSGFRKTIPGRGRGIQKNAGDIIHSCLSETQRRQYGVQIRYALCRRKSGVFWSVPPRKLTGLGVNPVGELQWQFLYRWLYGVVEPLSGKHFMLEFSHQTVFALRSFYKRYPPSCLRQIAQMYPHELQIQVDNAQAHSAQTLTVPEYVILLFQPPYCREVNPMERVGQQLKRWLQWRHFDSIADLQQAISLWVPRLTPRQVQSLTQWGWIVDALCVAGI